MSMLDSGHATALTEHAFGLSLSLFLNCMFWGVKTLYSFEKVALYGKKSYASFKSRFNYQILFYFIFFIPYSCGAASYE